MKCSKHAMKVIKKSRISNGQINNLNDPAKIMNEINIMKSLRHVRIVILEISVCNQNILGQYNDDEVITYIHVI